jgi:hypothetical protein
MPAEKPPAEGDRILNLPKLGVPQPQKHGKNDDRASGHGPKTGRLMWDGRVGQMTQRQNHGKK